MKRILSLIICVLLCLGTLGAFAGCGAKDQLLIWTFTDEIESMVKDFYIKNVDTKANIKVETIPFSSFTTRLDNALKTGKNLPDIVALEEKIIRKYIESDKLLALDDMLGGDTDEMYSYTFETARHSNGEVMGLAWQATPGAMYYRASLAKTYLDVDTPEEMQELVSTWAGVVNVAKTLKEAADIRIFSSVSAPSRVFFSQRSNGWVVDGKLNIPENLYNDDPYSLYELTKTLQVGSGTLAKQNPYINETTETQSAWFNDMSSDSVFSYLLGSWGLHYDLKPNAKSATSDKTTAGDWRVVLGPGSYSDGGTWLGILKSSTKQAEAKKLIKYFTTDVDFMRAWANKTGDFMNNKALMNEISQDYEEEFLGGQNHYKVLCEAAESINGNIVTRYDSYMNSSFNEWTIKYAKGETTKVGAINGFKEGIAGGYRDIVVE